MKKNFNAEVAEERRGKIFILHLLLITCYLLLVSCPNPIVEKLLEPFDRIITPTITTTSLPPGGVDVAYNATLSASGTQPITWSFEGSSPGWLNLSTNGVLSGTPTTADTYNFIVRATNSIGSDTRNLSITVSVVAVDSITITTLPTKRTYFVGDSFDPTGLVVRAYYDNGTSAVVANSLLTIVGYSSSAGEKTITIEYQSVTSTNSFTVTVVSSPEMVTISATTTPWLVNGSNPADGTATLSAFQMGKYEVTQELYEAVMGYNPSSFSSNPAAGEVQSKRPVEMVTWYDAIEFCNKLSEKEGLTPVYTITVRTPTTGYPITSATVTPNWSNNGYRLPTEAQWQYAAQSGSSNEYTATTSNAWYSDNSNSTHEVGKKNPNDMGLYDMLGNVYEWCWDRYAASPYPSSSNDPTGAASGSYRVRRGGCWGDGDWYARSAQRSNGNPDFRGFSLGFRVVRP